MNKHLLCGVLAAVSTCLAQPALAQSAGTWTLALGAHQVNPKSDNGSVLGGTADLEIGSDAKPTVMLEYFVGENLGVELLAAVPFKHDIDVKGLGKVGSTKQLPPTFTLQYHFNSHGKVSPFLGAGVNYTTFFDEDTSGALEGARLQLEDSWGLAAHAGLDFAVGERGALRVDVRWMDIDSDVKLQGSDIGTAEIDPLAYGVAYVWKF
jgi:outer membrane protein